MEIGTSNHSAKGVMNGITITKVITPMQNIFTLVTIEVKEVSNGPSKHQVHVTKIEGSCTTKISYGMSISP
jgi:hypothetical protein